jgi:aspartyl/asparaginyl-tRNA synthetase
LSRPGILVDNALTETSSAGYSEPHETARHLAQYLSLDAELGFIDDHHDVMAVLREVTAGQRLHRQADYLAALAERGEDPRPYESYLAVFAAGMPPHGGFAMGLERWTARLTGAGNVRRVTLFPRDLRRLTP